ncbi:hypothetical protein CR513_45318, partial [Mucuna pruriens]
MRGRALPPDSDDEGNRGKVGRGGDADDIEEIDGTRIPINFREVVVEPFDGTHDPHTHLQAFQTQMYISGGNDPLSCKRFWFAANRVKWLEVTDLFDIRQAKGETLKSYLAQFNNATVQEAANHGGDKDTCREAHQGRGGPGRPAQGRATVWPVGAQVRNAWWLERGGKVPGPAQTKGLPPDLHPLAREKSTDTVRDMPHAVVEFPEGGEGPSVGSQQTGLEGHLGRYVLGEKERVSPRLTRKGTEDEPHRDG